MCSKTPIYVPYYIACTCCLYDAGRNDFDAWGKIGPLEGVGPENLALFWARERDAVRSVFTSYHSPPPSRAD
jgi:hypothetical protein